MAAETASSQTHTDAVAPLGAPFERPFQYIGMTISKAASAVGGRPNAVGNVVIDSELSNRKDR